MLFHTWIFAVFLLVVWPVYLAVKGTRFRELWLLAASCVFYGWWNPYYLLLILFATAVDYGAVQLMSLRQGRAWRGVWLAVSIANNLALLGQFKYAGFLVNSLNDLLAWRGVAAVLPPPGQIWPPGFQALTQEIAALLGRVGIHSTPPVGLLLPVGISFHVFESMSYTIDYYRGHIDREKSFIRYAAFVALFPQLVAGPIMRAADLLPQLRTERKVRLADVTDGLSLFVVGMFKKVALADYLALYVDKVYKAPGGHGATALLLATFAFTWQIYFDFAGYTDMARGAARMMGFRLMLNFNNPYLAAGLGEFWQRWHISLSTWFRDYVYIPLGGNRLGRFRTYQNMIVTMVLSGLWHGAAWKFIIWGALHAAGRVLTRGLEGSRLYRDRTPKLLKQAWVFAFVMLTWVFFRAANVGDAWTILRGIFRGFWTDPRFPLLAAGLVAAVWAYQFIFESRLRRVLEYAPIRVALVAAMLLYMALIPAGESQPFIYFQF